jgi:hypothetical protein
MPTPLNSEWLNSNSLRAYPLRENSTRYPTLNGQAVTGTQLPNYVLLDFSIATSAPIERRMYVSSVSYTPSSLTLIISDDLGVQVGIVGAFTSTPDQYETYDFVGVGTYAEALGKITIGNLANLVNDFVLGTYTFEIGATEFEPTTIRSGSRGIKSLRIIDTGVTSEPLYGDLTLIAGSNISLTYLPDDNAIRIDAITGDGLIEECACTEESARLTNVVRTINGIAVENFQMEGGDGCIQVESSGNTLKITNKCTEPCCDCPELEFLTQSLQVLNSSIKNLESYAAQLETRMTTFMQSYILTVAGA